jgi:glutamate synthase domain-containing protein 3
MRTGRDVAIACLLGAEEFGFCTAVLVVLGCVMLRHCHLNNCSVGVATQDDILQDRFAGKVEQVINYFNFVGRELREVMASLGIRTVEELIGRTDLLSPHREIFPWKAKALDLSGILYRPEAPRSTRVYCTQAQNHNIDKVLDRKLIDKVIPALKEDRDIEFQMPIANVDRATGAMLSGEICRTIGDEILGEDTVRIKFKGVAGQSFGAFLVHGVTFTLEGLANDYVGKGISGGKLIVYPDRKAGYIPENNIIIGNTTFYGAISGQAYLRGLAGERFCIRNSGLYAVVEGVGDHGCEYMTGGRVVVIGKTGRNFAAGMSGGIAYVYDRDGSFKNCCNMEMVEFEKMGADDRDTVYNLLCNHLKYTKSPVAKIILDNFGTQLEKFVKVMPIEYKRITEDHKKGEGKMSLAEVSDG